MHVICLTPTEGKCIQLFFISSETRKKITKIARISNSTFLPTRINRSIECELVKCHYSLPFASELLSVLVDIGSNTRAASKATRRFPSIRPLLNIDTSLGRGPPLRAQFILGKGLTFSLYCLLTFLVLEQENC